MKNLPQREVSRLQGFMSTMLFAMSDAAGHYEDIVLDRDERFSDKSDNWQDSERGYEFEENTERVRERADELREKADEIEVALDEFIDMLGWEL